MSYLSKLNPIQRDAVKKIEGPVMIVAGAGSGKTRVLTYRIAYLLQCGVPAYHILALTFTNKAAREMRDRISTVVQGDNVNRLWMGTFHATFARLLRKDAEHIGFDRNFSIYDTEDSQSLVKNIMNDFSISTQQISPAAIRHAISNAKNRMKTADDLANEATDIFGKRVHQVFVEYAKRLKSCNAMDFDDLLLYPVRLFDEYPEILKRYQQQFRFILIDEYQDTNRVQYQIVRRLASSHRNICVVGDDAQSIYGFRGADISNILNFEKHFSDANVFRLEQNYRSTKTILQGADSLIKNNPSQIKKTMWTDNDTGDPITVVETTDELEEAMRIVLLMQEESRKHKLQLNDFAVLYRTNAQSRAIEDAFRRSGITYTIVGGVEFYRRKEIKDTLAYLRLIVNPNDDEAFLRIINYPMRGIGSTSISRLRNYAIENELSLFKTATMVAVIPSMATVSINRFESFIRLIQKYSRLRSEISAGELGNSLVDELGIMTAFKNEGTLEARNRMENVQELLSALAAFESEDATNSLELFLEQASLVADVDALDQSRNAVTLMTLHAAKGLEFPVVFLAGMEEGLFPSIIAIDNDEVDEERRLCYVGMTRAQKKLYFMHSRTRLRWGHRYDQIPSRFLEEIDQSLLRYDVTRRKNIPLSTGDALRKRIGLPVQSEYDQDSSDSSYSQIDQELHIGSRVMHATFGRGKLIGMEGSGEMARVVVVFDSVGKKTLIVKFADLKVL